MPVETIIQPYSVISWGLVWGLIGFAATGIVYVGKGVFRYRKTISKGAKIVSQALAENERGEDNSNGEPTVSAAILQYLQAQERRDIAERQAREARDARIYEEETRRWNRVEALTLELKDQASALQSVIIAIQNAANMQEQAHDFHSRQISELRENQIKLSDWLRENIYRPRQAGT